MYIAAVIELEACARSRAKCVNIADRYNGVLTEIERCFNRIGLINDYTKMLNVPTCSRAIFFLFQVAYYIY
jgi:hypothetical protein